MKSKSGQMMIEVLFALAVVAVVLVALMGSAIVSLKNARLSKNIVLANHYAQQTMENALAYKNRHDFDDLIEGCYSEISSSDMSPLINCDADMTSFPFIMDKDVSDTIYRRKINIVNEESGDRKRVTASIVWRDNDCESGVYCHQSEIIGYLSRWID